jgi:hypothetical protein
MNKKKSNVETLILSRDLKKQIITYDKIKVHLNKIASFWEGGRKEGTLTFIRTLYLQTRDTSQ